ncbi:MAG TPA: hypothetical protein VFN02_02475, partial [Ktedonobacteraceae bacterium]|nr:hypothetical protein [Ktedonobacteraceae bacterium]
MVTRISRRLPGFGFEAQTPPPTDVLPRMDVAVFVGFAAAGPLHKPVAIEDSAQFATIFGSDLPLAWDTQRGEQITAYLAPTVRAFFRNGGRRCWVVRVASDQAQYNYFSLPGMMRVTGNGEPVIVPAIASARSQGSWSDDLSVGTSLLSLPIAIASFAGTAPFTIDLRTTSPDDIVEGDLLRVTFRAAHTLAFTLAGPVQPPPATTAGKKRKDTPGTIRVMGKHTCWFSTQLSPVVNVPISVTLFTWATPSPAQAQPVVQEYQAWGTYSVSGSDNEQGIELSLPLPLPVVPEPGTILRLASSTGPVFMSVEATTTSYSLSSPPTETLLLTGPGLRLLAGAPAEVTAGATAVCERLTFELWTRESSDAPTRLSNLTFGADHPRYWGALPTDEQLYDQVEAPSSITPVSLWQATPSNQIYSALWQDASMPRFALAGPADTQNGQATDTFYLPLGIGVLPENFLRTTSLTAELTALERDGLDDFNASLFLDDRLQSNLARDLLAEADFIRYQALDPDPLHGIYAALAVAEATLVAVPDALHRGWIQANMGSSFIEPMQADYPPETKPVHCESQQGLFSPCDQFEVTSPAFIPTSSPYEPVSDTNTFSLNWFTPTTGQEVSFSLQEASDSHFGTAQTIYKGSDEQITIYGHSAGDYYYRVRVTVNGISSDWSHGLHVHLASTSRWQLKDKSSYDEKTVIALHYALLRLCAARDDMCALLTLPEHYYAADVIDYVTRLKAGIDPGFVPPLVGEPFVYSYGSLYHPWLLTLDDVGTAEVMHLPPDGAVCGMIAQRAIERGAWIAPANVPLQEVVGLSPAIARSSWLPLQNIQVNLVRQEPHGFVVLNEDTLSDDEDLRPFNVRRLLILLRRQALLQGANYVFEPNNNSFRRRVQRSFEATLELLFVRGAFAGNTPESAFQVRVDGTLNTSQSMDQGQFVVELRVAPSLPLT